MTAYDYLRNSGRSTPQEALVAATERRAELLADFQGIHDLDGATAAEDFDAAIRKLETEEAKS